MIKLIATDMDGSFYDSNLNYDKELFNKMQAKMKEEGVEFVLASGNQYFQLISFFENPDEFSYVSENGGLIVSKGKEVAHSSLTKEELAKIQAVLKQYPELIAYYCGLHEAYADSSVPFETIKFSRNWFPKLDYFKKPLLELEDPILKVALIVPGQDEESKAYLKILEENANQEGTLHICQSGFDNIDIMKRNTNKGTAIQTLCEKWSIKPEEVMAFGDAMNDYEMLDYAGYGFAMKNGTDDLKEKIGRITEIDNDHMGMLKTVEEYFDDPEAFLEKYK